MTINHVERRKKRRRIAKAVKCGATVSAAAVEYNVGKTTVYNSCNECKVATPGHPDKGKRFLTHRNKAILAAMHRCGQAEAARRFGISRQRVFQIKMKVMEVAP